MLYRIELSPAARGVYQRLHQRDRRLFDRVDQVLRELAQDPFLGKPLKGELAGKRSYRLGPYRIIYAVFAQRLLVYVLDIGHRREIYR
ncbi:MAG: type II toxin-antitoxin system RelE/ParE family toxin [Elusimicrobia bacterium]|nr:type II toxin-antitoxin system RelE/ParE family toxin [Elusimicrobiota bacterium]